MTFTVAEVGNDFIRVWDGVSRVDKRPTEKHTDQYHVGRDHGFLPGDEVQVVVRLHRRKETEQE